MKRSTCQLAGLLCILLALVMAGCASNDTPTAPGDGGGGRTVKADPSLATDVQEIFNRRGCSGSSCHGSAQQAGLDLRTGASFGELVNVNSTQQPAVKRVLPSDTTQSYLVNKLEGTGSGQRMPQGGVPLDSIDMRNIINWISQGAKNN